MVDGSALGKTVESTDTVGASFTFTGKKNTSDVFAEFDNHQNIGDFE